MDLLESIEEAIRATETLKEKEAILFLEAVSQKIIECFSSGGKLLIAGNGGSLCDAMHFAEELTGFYREKRAPLPAIALSDPAHMSCVSNDTQFEDVFARLVTALGRPGDLFIALTTSGFSKNLIHAAMAAKKRGMTVVGFLGKTGGPLKDLCDFYWIVKGFHYSDRIQEAHMVAIHIIIDTIEKSLFPQIPGAEESSFLHREVAIAPLWANDVWE